MNSAVQPNVALTVTRNVQPHVQPDVQPNVQQTVKREMPRNGTSIWNLNIPLIIALKVAANSPARV